MLLNGIERVVRIPDWRLTTAEILYRMPDHPARPPDLRLAEGRPRPDFPELHGFLDFWRREIEGALHSVRVASAALWRPAEFTYAEGELRLH